MDRRMWLLTPLAAAALIAAVLVFWGQREAAPPQRLSCVDLQAGCSAEIDGRGIKLGFVGNPRVLQPFEVWVAAPGATKVQAQFNMVDMDMGFNLYTLKPDAAGVFRARITLPVCVSGQRDWIMILEVDGRRLELPFVTEI